MPALPTLVGIVSAESRDLFHKTPVKVNEARFTDLNWAEVLQHLQVFPSRQLGNANN